MWRERIVTQTGEVAKFKTFREFVEAYPPEGLHTDITFLIQLCNQFDDMEAVHLLSGAEAGNKGGSRNPYGAAGKPESININNINIDNRQKTAMGNSTAFTMRTLHHPQQQQGQHDEPDADADAGGKHDGAVALTFQPV